MGRCKIPSHHGGEARPFWTRAFKARSARAKEAARSKSPRPCGGLFRQVARSAGEKPPEARCAFDRLKMTLPLNSLAIIDFRPLSGLGQLRFTRMPLDIIKPTLLLIIGNKLGIL